ncbi:LysR family transcriptional regulator [Limnobaculum zhutongyuii]|uniref:LysR family transcriptional regulator n=1 Tax=Limnobaculum zhutongyuii TaxID=2498113 RepID=A0A411WGV6_9GAMM|nr:LysR family transcriptional regulator [Limnobaculum zhutongyuii]QBH95531.1 LysR family transcriptional regulator [Limnobaculum zhutongyuii]TQS88779.1 LysR family transcriptional regulator [Limnobaculum zhutongyuii]
MLDKIIFFCAVVKSGSLSKAAEEFNISVSAASRWVAELEKEMGVSLLKRSTRRVSPSQTGMHLYEKFEPLARDAREMIEEVMSTGNDYIGLIRIASTPLFATEHLVDIISSFLIEYPKIKVKLFINPFPVNLVDEVDFSIRAQASYKGKIDHDSSDVRKRLVSEPLVTVASSRYLSQHPAPQSPEDLADHCCLYSKSLVGGNKWQFFLNGKVSIYNIPNFFECDNSEILKRLALNHAGIAYLPKSLVEEDIRQGHLVSILENYMASTFDINLYYKRREHYPARLSLFKDYLINSLEKRLLEKKK